MNILTIWRRLMCGEHVYFHRFSKLDYYTLRIKQTETIILRCMHCDHEIYVRMFYKTEDLP